MLINTNLGGSEWYGSSSDAPTSIDIYDHFHSLATGRGYNEAEFW